MIKCRERDLVGCCSRKQSSHLRQRHTGSKYHFGILELLPRIIPLSHRRCNRNPLLSDIFLFFINQFQNQQFYWNILIQLKDFPNFHQLGDWIAFHFHIEPQPIQNWIFNLNKMKTTIIVLSKLCLPYFDLLLLFL